LLEQPVGQSFFDQATRRFDHVAVAVFLLTAQSGLAQEQGFNVGGLSGGAFSIDGEVVDTFPDAELKNTGVSSVAWGMGPLL
jgi:hypothetical protein